ncbi:MAG TPA: hemerythrin domain-containing protein [Burkholderiales bacterium]|nr:hemerythrin domain-containing protein [Burkholderiales bacterium]
MISHIPASLKAEHDQLHAELDRAAGEPGALGEAARVLARLLHPHFVKEERYAMPALTLLPKLAWGTVSSDMAWVLPLTRRLKAELPLMVLEHKDIVAALERFRARAQEAGRADYERFAEALMLHAQTEEEVLYPAAELVGQYLEIKLGTSQRAETPQAEGLAGTPAPSQEFTSRI